jgi:hypothetical protein
MAKFKWGDELIFGNLWVLYVEDEDYRYASLRYSHPPRAWRLRLRGWEEFQDIDFTDQNDPPKEFVESLVLLAFNIGDKDD